MKFIVGKKIGMTRVYDKGKSEAVTLVLVKPNFVSQIKDEKTDGYKAVQIACGETKRKDGRRIGSLKKANLSEKMDNFVEFTATDLTNLKIGDKIDISQFKIGDKVKVVGVSYGKGFAGVMKRHHFKGAPHSHGHKHDWRAPGSINSGHPQHVMKGRRMGGRMGGERVTVSNLAILNIDSSENILALKGATPGKTNGWLKITA